MKKFDLFDKVYGSIFKVSRSIVLDEKNVTKALAILNEFQIAANGVNIGSCNWASDTSKWFINFQARRQPWETIKERLYFIEGTVFVVDRPQKVAKYEEL